jgi:transcription elongation GreA/GreB family factor
MNKRLVIEAIIAKLQEDLEVLHNAARASHAEATHESSKAENKYDTRGLEAGYLAQGQMKQGKQTEEAILEFQKLPLVDLEPNSVVGIGALVEVESKTGQSLYFIGPRGGGIEVEVEDRLIVVLTPQAPLGQLMMGKRVGERFLFKQGKDKGIEYRIGRVA